MTYPIQVDFHPSMRESILEEEERRIRDPIYLQEKVDTAINTNIQTHKETNQAATYVAEALEQMQLAKTPIEIEMAKIQLNAAQKAKEQANNRAFDSETTYFSAISDASRAKAAADAATGASQRTAAPELSFTNNNLENYNINDIIANNKARKDILDENKKINEFIKELIHDQRYMKKNEPRKGDTTWNFSTLVSNLKYVAPLSRDQPPLAVWSDYYPIIDDRNYINWNMRLEYIEVELAYYQNKLPINKSRLDNLYTPTRKASLREQGKKYVYRLFNRGRTSSPPQSKGGYKSNRKSNRRKSNRKSKGKKAKTKKRKLNRKNAKSKRRRKR
jgi:hypothetical protein